MPNLLTSVKEKILEKYSKISIFGVFLKFTKQSKATNTKIIDRQSFEALLASVGFCVNSLKSTVTDGYTNLDLLYQAFDRDCDGMISSNDFVDTV